MVEVPKKKITLEGLKNAFKLYSYIKPFRIEYSLGHIFPDGFQPCKPGLSETAWRTG